MVNVINNINKASWRFLEENLIPSHEKQDRLFQSITVIKKTMLTVLSIPIVTITSILALASKVVNYVVHFFMAKEKIDPKNHFSAVVKDGKLWNQLGDIKESLLQDPPGKDHPNFLYGIASCTYQDSGAIHCPHSQWSHWEHKVLEKNNQSGKSANLFELYKTQPMEVVSRLKKLEVNCYRTSVEWSQIEPQQGKFNKEALKVYADFCKLLRDHGIQPMITLHHFSEPQWFHDLGSFENEENIAHFVNFSEYVYAELAQPYKTHAALVEYFCTINEPGIEAFGRFIRAGFSPGKLLNFERGAQFLKGALKAHFAAYKALKKINPETKIGFTHQYFRLITSNPLIFAASKYLNHLISEVTLNLFKTQTFEVKVPFSCHVIEQFKPEDMGADFIGVQFYGRPIISLFGPTTQHKEEEMTQMPFHEDPAGLYEAITEVHKATKKPIIVTENGISTHDPKQRARYMERALYALREAEKNLGKDVVLGYIKWCFVNNLEWDLGMYPQAFGAYTLESDSSLE
jgi:beta-glucosidase